MHKLIVYAASIVVGLAGGLVIRKGLKRYLVRKHAQEIGPKVDAALGKILSQLQPGHSAPENRIVHGRLPTGEQMLTMTVYDPNREARPFELVMKVRQEGKDAGAISLTIFHDAGNEMQILSWPAPEQYAEPEPWLARHVEALHDAIVGRVDPVPERD